VDGQDLTGHDQLHDENIVVIGDLEETDPPTKRISSSSPRFVRTEVDRITPTSPSPSNLRRTDAEGDCRTPPASAAT
jgi:hypothetical protein